MSSLFKFKNKPKALTFIVLKERAFTLIELLIVIAIIGGLVTFLFPQLNNFNKSQTLEDSAKSLQITLRMVQNNATSGVRCNNTVAASSWYIKFTDSATSYLTGTTCSISDIVAGDPTPVPFVSIFYNLPSGISIESLKLDSCASNLTGDDHRIIFNNISGKVNFETNDAGCPVDSTTSKMTIALQIDSNPGDTVNVIVEKGGSVYVSSR